MAGLWRPPAASPAVAGAYAADAGAGTISPSRAARVAGKVPARPGGVPTRLQVRPGSTRPAREPTSTVGGVTGGVGGRQGDNKLVPQLPRYEPGGAGEFLGPRWHHAARRELVTQDRPTCRAARPASVGRPRRHVRGERPPGHDPMRASPRCHQRRPRLDYTGSSRVPRNGSDRHTQGAVHIKAEGYAATRCGAHADEDPTGADLVAVVTECEQPANGCWTESARCCWPSTAPPSAAGPPTRRAGAPSCVLVRRVLRIGARPGGTETMAGLMAPPGTRGSGSRGRRPAVGVADWSGGWRTRSGSGTGSSRQGRAGPAAASHPAGAGLAVRDQGSRMAAEVVGAASTRARGTVEDPASVGAVARAAAAYRGRVRAARSAAGPRGSRAPAGRVRRIRRASGVTSSIPAIQSST